MCKFFKKLFAKNWKPAQKATPAETDVDVEALQEAAQRRDDRVIQVCCATGHLTESTQHNTTHTAERVGWPVQGRITVSSQCISLHRMTSHCADLVCLHNQLKLTPTASRGCSACMRTQDTLAGWERSLFWGCTATVATRQSDAISRGS